MNLYDGKNIQLSVGDDGIANLVFNAEGSVNKFDSQTVQELQKAVEIASSNSDIKGMLVTSGKPLFIVGADITEFGALFKESQEVLVEWLLQANSIFNAIEDLPFPTVTLINGQAQGGGCEMALSTDFRVTDTKGNIGLPEIKLGIYPGFGGTVRLPRLIGVDNAIDIICAGKSLRAADALKMHLVDAVVELDKLETAGRKILNQAIEGKLDYESRRKQKTGKVQLPMGEQMIAFQISEQFIKGQSKGHYPAPVEAVKTMKKAAGKSREKAIEIEAKGFAKLAQTTEAQSLIGLFLNDQLIKAKGKKYGKIAKKVEKAAVLGAGIMGGGIAYQSAYKNVPIVMKDINQSGIDLGIGEATKLLSKIVKIGKIDAPRMAQVLANINPTLSYGKADFADVDVVVEAVVENIKVKHMVLAEVEKVCKPGTVITSNTSSISIDILAEAMEHPENFCGMHFFNPVHKMPLVEIIRGSKTSDETIATVVSYATKLGKTPIVVNDCPGFLVNRVLFPYFAGFQLLVNEGVDFQFIDKTMERFGWPMGPAYLLDVVGIDTAHHVGDVLAEGFPDRMQATERTSIDVMYENERYGQKNNKGYYQYTLDRKGKPKKAADESVYELLKDVQKEGTKEVSKEEVIERLMIPMIIETARCLEEDIVATHNEADMGLIMGLGFPPFRGGALRYADTLGLAAVCEIADKYAHLGEVYQPTKRMREMAANGETYYKN